MISTKKHMRLPLAFRNFPPFPKHKKAASIKFAISPKRLINTPIHHFSPSIGISGISVQTAAFIATAINVSIA